MKKTSNKKGNPTRAALLGIVFVILLTLSLAGCSGGNSELMAENEKLSEELGAANKSLEAVDPKIEELESRLDAVDSKIEELESKLNSAEAGQSKESSEDTVKESRAVSAQAEIAPPKSDPQKLLTGEWFFQDFHEEYVFSWLQSLVFREDGTGTIIRTFYIPGDIEGYSNSDPSGEVTSDFSWSLNGDALHTEYVSADGGFVDYTFSHSEQRLFIENENGALCDGTMYYSRQKPPIPENYIEESVYLGNEKAKEKTLMRDFLGSWYYDVLVWTFNEDGTGNLDIPKLADNPAEKRDFTFKVSDDNSSMMLTIDWTDGRISFFWPTVNLDGSITLQGAKGSEPVKLTRQFDASNCPITEKIIENELGVLSGSIFSNIIPE